MSHTKVGILCIALIEISGFVCIVVLALYDHAQNIPSVIMAMGTAGALIPNMLQSKQATDKAGEALKESQTTTKKVDQVATNVDNGIQRLSHEATQAAAQAAHSATQVATTLADAVIRASETVAKRVAEEKVAVTVVVPDQNNVQAKVAK